MSEEEDEVFIDDDDDDDDDDESEELPEIVVPTDEESSEDTPVPEVDEKFEELKNQFNPQNGAQLRLLKDLVEVQKMDEKDSLFTAQPIRGELSSWEVRITKFDPKDEIAKDMKKYEKMTGKNAIVMHVSFPPDYPMHPPFVRVVEPRFILHTGRVTVGGSICTDVLTMEANGWNPMYDIQSLILNIISVMLDGKPKIDFCNMTPYSLNEAKAAFFRVASDHNWKVNDWAPKY